MAAHSNPNAAPQSDADSATKVAAGCGIGCLITAIVVVLVVVGGFFFVTNWLKGKAEELTDDAPIAIEAPDGTDAEIDAVILKFDNFREALATGKSAQPFSLTTEEANLLIYNHPDLTEMVGKVKFEFIDDKVAVDGSVPLDGINKLVEGRFLNGRALMKFAFVEGRLTLDLESVEANGMKVPEVFMKGFRDSLSQENIASGPEFDAMKKIIGSIYIEEGVLKVVPKPIGERTAP